MKKVSYITAAAAGLLLTAGTVSAQFSVDGQVITRADYRHGFGNLIQKDDQPAAFYIEQRSRLIFSHKTEKFKTFFSVQDVRVWGDTAQISRADGKIMLHEGWGEYSFNNHWSTRIGRQELDYDDARILGNLDWAMQARSHDAALIMFSDTVNTLHIGLTYNQNKVQTNTTSFGSALNYKTMSYVWYHRNFNPNMGLSVLFLNHGKQFNYTNYQGVQNFYTVFSQTAGFRFTWKKVEGEGKDAYSKMALNAAAYGQFGKENAMTSLANDTTPKSVMGVYGALEFTFMPSKAFGFTLGGEYISGNSQTDTTKAYNEVNHAFNPYYGTNHKFNGYMDYFYVGNYVGQTGLINPYVKVRYNSENYWVQADVHYFMAAADIIDDSTLANTGEIKAASAGMGTEIDITFNYKLTKGVNFQFGYSHMLATESMAFQRGGGKYEGLNNWAYAMVIFKPGIFKSEK